MVFVKMREKMAIMREKNGVYGKARYSQIRRYSQIQNVLARVFKHPSERDFLFLLSIENLSRRGV